MPRRWTKAEENKKISELQRLYVEKNKTIGEIANILGVAPQTVFKRMGRLGIASNPKNKATYIAKRRSDIFIPRERSEKLAEFFGVMLGDGHLSKYQTVITLGTKEENYVNYIVELFENLFGVRPKVGLRRNGFRDIYLGSLDLVEWLAKEGLVSNKVLYQVGAPSWIMKRKKYARGFLRGFFDTDGSIYKLKFGLQISFTNKSIPLLTFSRKSLVFLGYKPSRVSGFRVYLTRRSNVVDFFKDVRPANKKHLERFSCFVKAQVDP